MNIYSKIAKVRSEVGVLLKTETNPFFKSKYVDVNGLIESVYPALKKENLLLLQPIIDGIVKSVIIDVDSSEQVESGLLLPNIEDPQKIGSCITYYRRYTLQSLLALQAEDDDANAASGHSNATTNQAKQSQDDDKKWLNVLDGQKNLTKEWQNIVSAISSGKITSVSDVRKYYKVATETAQRIEELLKKDEV